jgi:prepilin-type processing-associated H-X9-DG protein
LPYLEQSSTYNALNFKVAADHTLDGGLNATANVTRINSLLCPSSPLPVGGFWNYSSTGYEYEPWINNQVPGNNYFASVGPSFVPWETAKPPGIFMIVGPSWVPGGGMGAAPRRVSDVQDGTSNTIAFGEWKMGDFDTNKYSLQDGVNIGINGISSLNGFGSWNSSQNFCPQNAANFQTLLNACAAYGPKSIQSISGTWKSNKSELGRSWTHGQLGCSMGTTLLPPNSIYPNCQMEPWGGDMDAPGMWNLSSFHPGGANIALADGSVRFLKSSTSMPVVWYLGSRAGQEVVSADSY